MKELKLKTWEEFEDKITALFNEVKKTRETRQPLHVSNLLFRGQGNAAWKLQTTLERFSSREFKMTDYHRVMEAVQPALETHTGRTWDLRQYEEYNHDESSRLAPPGYDFMVYLRHHGFPSPLLDWTRSPYIAAFFAFRSVEGSLGDNVAIFVYQEYLGHGKGGRVGAPQIVGCGPYVRTHPRHFVQQGEYTICKKKSKDDAYVYCSHEEVFKQGNAVIPQDSLIKLILPKTERKKIREKLEIMNINAFSLFNNEETLVEWLAYQEIERKRP